MSDSLEAIAEARGYEIRRSNHGDTLVWTQKAEPVPVTFESFKVFQRVGFSIPVCTLNRTEDLRHGYEEKHRILGLLEGMAKDDLLTFLPSLNALLEALYIEMERVDEEIRPLLGLGECVLAVWRLESAASPRGEKILNRDTRYLWNYLSRGGANPETMARFFRETCESHRTPSPVAESQANGILHVVEALRPTFERTRALDNQRSAAEHFRSHIVHKALGNDAISETPAFEGIRLVVDEVSFCEYTIAYRDSTSCSWESAFEAAEKLVAAHGGAPYKSVGSFLNSAGKRRAMERVGKEEGEEETA